uniref:ERF1 domain 3 protein n=1 Tax=Solibacter usitatus (strain Ellin6076) TaxID=234267 RepID=Q024P4_SOLUE
MATKTETIQEVSTSIEEPLDRLLRFEPTTLPVISLYLNLQPDGHGRDPDVRGFAARQLKRMAGTWSAGSAERASFDQDSERILAYLEERINPAANGVAIFACAGAGEFFEAVQLVAPIDENLVYVYSQPHLYHLSRLNEMYPRYAAVITDANTARLMVFGLGGEIEIEEVKGKKVHRVKVGGWSQARYQRRVTNAHDAHAKEVVTRLEEVVRKDGVKKIILAGDPAMAPLLMENLPKNLADMVVDTVRLDLQESDAAVLAKTLEKVQESSAQDEAQVVEEVLNGYRSGGLATIGAEAVLEALANGQVDELLIGSGIEREHADVEPVDAILAPEIPDSAGSTESDDPRPVSLPDLLVTKAKQTDASVRFIQNSELLAGAGGVAAVLRWRN